MTGAHEGDYLEPYREAVRRVGPSFEALLWRNKDFQRLRLAVLASGMDLTGSVVADMGCGRADLVATLAERGVEYGRYIGVDGLPELVEECERRSGEAGWQETVFTVGDFVADEKLFERLASEHGAEIFIFGGSLNTLTQNAALAVLDRAWSAAKKADGGLVFNFLSTTWPSDSEADGPAHRMDPVAMLEWALSRTPSVRLRQDYLDGRDATVVMRPVRG